MNFLHFGTTNAKKMSKEDISLILYSYWRNLFWPKFRPKPNFCK